MKVVLATDDKKTLNGHFALSRSFLFYDISGEKSEFYHEENFMTDDIDEISARIMKKKPFCVEERLDSIKGCDLIFVSAIGGPIVDRVMETGVYPMEVNSSESLDTILRKLQELQKGDPPKWLKRILDKQD